MRRRDVVTSADEPQVQLSHSTRANRYPHVFKALQEVSQWMEFPEQRLLSYGCSTGEEVASLAEGYFAGSDIVGVDVVPDVIEEARTKYGSLPKVRFHLDKDISYDDLKGSFTIILAMSVLCRWPDTRFLDNIATTFPFQVFENHLRTLDMLLKPGGILAIYNASYSFLDSDIAEGYDLVLHPRVKTSGFVKRFEKDGSFRDAPKGAMVLFRKRAAGVARSPAGLTVRDARLREMGQLGYVPYLKPGAAVEPPSEA